MTLPQLRLFWIDAFTRDVGAGNPAAVVPLPEWLDEHLLQLIAYENGLSETSFIVERAAGDYAIRWFTPTDEVDLCGHATLAAAHAIWGCMGCSASQIVFRSRSGDLFVDRLPDGRLELDFPVRTPVAAEPPGLLIRGLGAVPSSFLRAEANLAVFDSEDEVRALRPDFAALAELEEYGTIATAPSGDCDFVSRFFAPRVGVPEDPVTGSAHCILAPYWADRLGRSELHCRQISKRGGELWCSLVGSRVKISGHAVLYMKAEIQASGNQA